MRRWFGGRCLWKLEHRRAADRRGLRYPGDMTETEWTGVAPLIPPARRGGRPRKVDVCEVLNAIFYHELYVRSREQAGREASPTLAIPDACDPRRLRSPMLAIPDACDH